jgi:hypothetical protein
MLFFLFIWGQLHTSKVSWSVDSINCRFQARKINSERRAVDFNYHHRKVSAATAEPFSVHQAQCARAAINFLMDFIFLITAESHRRCCCRLLGIVI